MSSKSVTVDSLLSVSVLESWSASLRDVLDDDDDKLKLSRLSSFALSIFPREIVRSHARLCGVTRSRAKSRGISREITRLFDARVRSECVSVTVESTRRDRRR